jgi:hypothetical protein
MLRSADPEQEHRRHETVSQWYRSSRMFFFKNTIQNCSFPLGLHSLKGLQSALNNNED